MKKSLLTMAAALALVSCSQDDLMTGIENRPTGAIGVKPYVPTITRGTALNSEGDLVNAKNGFDLFAFLGDASNTQFMGTVSDGVAFQGSGTDTYAWDYVSDNEMKFWSEANGSAIKFYAVSPMNEKTTTLTTGSLVKNIKAEKQELTYTVPTTCSEQVDLMYAVTDEYASDDESAEHVTNGITLQFRHALSQIVFKAKTESELIFADIESVKITNLNGAGTFNLANAETYRTAEDKKGLAFPWNYTGEANSTFVSDVIETTDINTDADGNTSVTAGKYTTKVTGGAISLTESSEALLLLPQNLKTNSAALEISCKVRYKRGEGDVAEIVGSSTEYKTITVPVETSWEPGYKYTYTLIFTAEMGNPIKVKSVGVDKWNDATEEDVNVGGEDESEEIVEIEGLRYSVTNQHFYIDDVESLTKMAQLVNGHDKTYTEPTSKESLKFGEATYMQTQTIDFSEVEATAYDQNGSTSNFTPIGIYGYTYGAFGGIYNGQGHSIKGLKFTQGSSQVIHTALFNEISGAEISNLTVEGNISAQSAVAGIVSEDEGNSVIMNCVSNVDISMVSSARTAGGIIGKTNGTKLINCVNNGDIIQSTGADWLGGIVGNSEGATVITACVNNGNIKGENNIGGLVGIDGGGVSIYASYNTGTINATAAGNGSSVKPVGGLVGQLKGIIIGCYNLGTVLLNDSEYEQDTYTYVGAIAGVEYNEGLETAEAIKACYWGGECKSDNGLGITGWAVSDEVKKAMNDALNATDCGYIFNANEDNTLLVPVKK